MGGEIQKHQGQIFSLNIDDLDIDELERRLEMAVASTDAEAIDVCGINKECGCEKLGSCGTYC